MYYTSYIRYIHVYFVYLAVKSNVNYGPRCEVCDKSYLTMNGLKGHNSNYHCGVTFQVNYNLYNLKPQAVYILPVFSATSVERKWAHILVYRSTNKGKNTKNKQDNSLLKFFVRSKFWKIVEVTVERRWIYGRQAWRSPGMLA